MLQKDDLPYIHRLQIIQLFEADFNGAMKIIYSRQLLWHITERGLNNQQTYRGQKGKTVADLIIDNQLTYENSAIMRLPICCVFNNATGCYDRIINRLNIIVFRRLGMPESAAICLATALSKMCHKIRTKHGESINSIISTAVQEIYGVGQGNSAAVVSWEAHVEVMIVALEELCKGSSMSDPEATTILIQHLINYVDDTSLKQSYDPQSSIDQRLKDVIHLIKTWHMILNTTGGDLALKKCHVYFIHWNFKSNNPLPKYMLPSPKKQAI